jgi:hypothetical protein
MSILKSVFSTREGILSSILLAGIAATSVLSVVQANDHLASAKTCECCADEMCSCDDSCVSDCCASGSCQFDLKRTKAPSDMNAAAVVLGIAMPKLAGSLAETCDCTGQADCTCEVNCKCCSCK